MNRIIRLFWIVVLGLFLSGCLEVTPNTSPLYLEHGQTQGFTASSDISGITIIWRLDGQQVATGNEYTFVAENSSPQEVVHTLVVSEEAEDGDSVSWAIHVRPSPAQTANWTVMVYMAVDNDLEDDSIHQIEEMTAMVEEMARQGRDGAINVIVQMDRIEGLYEDAYNDWTTCKRFKVVPGMKLAEVEEIGHLGEVNMGNPQTLTDFIDWATENYAADRYALIISSHGTGWKGVVDDWTIPAGEPDSEVTSGSLTLEMLHNALRSAGKRMHLIGFDACFMGMLEVAYELSRLDGEETPEDEKRMPEIMVASEEAGSFVGFSYRFLSDLSINPTADARELGQYIVSRSYIANLNDPKPIGEHSNTYAAIDLSGISQLSNVVNEFADALVTYFDKAKDDSIAGKALSVMEQINTTVIYNRHGGNWPNAHGLSIYFPRRGLDSNYETIGFAAENSWIKFLQGYIASTTDGTWIHQARISIRVFGDMAHTGDGDKIDLFDFCQSIYIYGQDTDNDGLLDSKENQLPGECPFLGDRDSDDDGILDGDEDRNSNGIFDEDEGETDPCKPDTDGDGVLDGTEMGYGTQRVQGAWFNTADPEDTDLTKFVPDSDRMDETDPLQPDTDGDGIPDGVEDANHNGRVDDGETNPSNADEWTFLVYIDADNDLYVIDDFQGMAAVGSNKNVDIVVQLDRHATGDWSTCKRFHVTQGMEPIAGNEIEDLGEINMGSADRLSQFITWATERYPANHYALVIKSHGGGWSGIGMDQNIGEDETNVCPGDPPEDYLAIWEIREALEASGKMMDIIGFDSCLMAMIEVAHGLNAMADKTLVPEVLVASEEEALLGWAYEDILRYLDGYAISSATQLGAYIVDKNFPGSPTWSAIDMNKVDAISTALDGLAGSMAEGDSVSAVQMESEKVMSAIAEAVVHELHSDLYTGAGGLSIFFPLSLDEEQSWDPCGLYGGESQTIEFANATRWDEFLAKFHTLSSDSWIYEARTASMQFSRFNPRNRGKTHVDLYDFCHQLSIAVPASNE